MTQSIRDRADTIATFRWVSVHLMEMLARWVPTTPELEVKILFGRHIWEFAQHADALGRRTAELRAPLHFSLAPVNAYSAVLEELAPVKGTAERLHGLYQAVIPDLEARYHRYLDETNPLLDEPSVRIIDRILADLARLRADAAETAGARPDLRMADPKWPERLRTRALEVASFVALRSGSMAEVV
jgi:hypothetical protein